MNTRTFILRSPKMALGLASATLMMAATSGAAQATVLQASGGIITNRLCTNLSSTCTINTPAGPRFADGDVRLNPHQYYGGYGQEFATGAVSRANGASGSAEVRFGADYLPTVKVGSVSGADTRTGASATAFQAFTYDGLAAIDLAINGQLHFFTSGDAAGPPPASDFAGDGTLNVAFGLLRVSDLTSALDPSSTGRDIISNALSFADCDSGALAAGGYNSNGVAGGEYTTSIGLSTRCGGGAIRLNPGDSFVVFATLQALSNRGGFLDATHTFSVQYDEQNTYFAGTRDAVGTGFLASNVSLGAAVPEPATWALLIGGFGLAGSVLRRRRVAA